LTTCEVPWRKCLANTEKESHLCMVPWLDILGAGGGLSGAIAGISGAIAGLTGNPIFAGISAGVSFIGQLFDPGPFPKTCKL